MAENRLFLLDAFALIFRGYYAFIKNPRINSKGENTSAVLGFMNALLDIIRRERPEHLAVAFDKGGSVDRKEWFTDYKANRDETPEAIRYALPIIQDILRAMNIPILELEGYEADDIIGTIAKQAEERDYKVYMVTLDKDFAQLVSENIFLYKPARMGNGIEIWGVSEVCERFEIKTPQQVIDYLGMMGDAVDNIPGLPGVGDKTAKKFLKEYGSMEALLEHTDQLKGKMKEKIETNKELGLLSKKLATIILDVPVAFDAKKLEFSPANMDEVASIFQRLEFRRMIDTFQKIYDTKTPEDNLSDSSPQPSGKDQQLDLFSSSSERSTTETTSSFTYATAETTPHWYQYIETPLALDIFIKKLLSQHAVCFDTETTSLDTSIAALVGIAFSWESHKGYYVTFDNELLSKEYILEKLRPFFENVTIKKIGHNLKYDIQILAHEGIQVNGPFFDTMIAHYLLQADMRHKMDILAETYLNYKTIPIEQLIGKKGSRQTSMRSVPLSEQTEYAVEDADITRQLWKIFLPMLDQQEAKSLFEQVEIPLMQVLSDMEMKGIRVDDAFLNTLSKEFSSDIKQLKNKIYTDAGEEFNIASPKQLGDIIFGKMKLVDKPKKTKTGQYATSEEVLSHLAEKHSIIASILEYRQLQKLQSTYVKALPDEINPKTGRVHTNYSQTVAATGRLSSNHPNLQNIPIRTERGRAIRKAFVPKNKDYLLLSADYSQIELRIIAALSGDENMIQSFKNKEDIHAATAAKIFQISLEDVTRDQRSQAKTVNFGIIYGVSAFGLSNQTNLSRSESKELIDTYYATYPKLRQYISNQISFAQETGYVETILGRRRYLREIRSANSMVRSAAERNAINAPIQGSAADIIKIAMINIHKKLKLYQSEMLLQVHDELIFDMHRSEEQELKALVRQEMEYAYELSVPLEVDMGVGDHWLEAH